MPNPGFNTQTSCICLLTTKVTLQVSPCLFFFLLNNFFLGDLHSYTHTLDTFTQIHIDFRISGKFLHLEEKNLLSFLRMKSTKDVVELGRC